MPEASIVITAKDKYSSVIKALTNHAKSFSKTNEELERRLESLDRTQDKLADSIAECRKEMKAAQKQFDDTGRASDKIKFEKKRDELTNLTRAMGAVKTETKAVERNIRSLNGAMEKTGSAGTNGFGGIRSAMAGIGTAMAGQVVSQLIQPGVNALASSAFGSDVGSIVSSALSGVISGAAIGSAIPVIGAPIGAVVGGVIGATSGWMQVEEKKDDYFKSYYNGIVDEQKQRRAAAIQNGSAIAASRETDRISFSTLFGDAGTANRYLDDLVDMSNRTPFLYDDLTAMSKTLATYGYGADSILPVLKNIGDAGAALGMNTGDMSMVATALGRMKSSDKATLEYLNILNDRGIGAVGMLAEAKRLSVGDTYDAISKGKIKGGTR